MGGSLVPRWGGRGGEGPGNEARWEVTYPNMEPKGVEIAVKKRLLSVDLNTGK